MFRSVRSAALDVSNALRSLPTTHVAYFHEHSWLVIGPTGLYVVITEDGDIEAAAAVALQRARRLRTDLARELAWVPFVEAVVVVDSRKRSRPSVPALVVPIQRLADTISGGPQLVDDATLALLTRLRLDNVAN